MWLGDCFSGRRLEAEELPTVVALNDDFVTVDTEIEPEELAPAA